jgi:alkylation response protein AidB-like acyl-CoA dehydrogenase
LPSLEQLVSHLLDEFPPDRVSTGEFLGARFDHGLAWVHFAVGRGGLDRPRTDQTVVEALLESAGGPPPLEESTIGLGMVAPALTAHGSTAQQTQHLRGIFTGEEIWCQLFSEPGAGSDIAALGTNARRQRDEWLINGQKIWTSHANRARFGLLAARTDPDKPKHRGITCFVLDMNQPGVTARPLQQITAESEFSEVFLDDARIPDTERLGDIGGGWAVMLTTLMNERAWIGRRLARRTGPTPIDQLLELYRRRPQPYLRHRIAGLWIQAECHRQLSTSAAARRWSTDPGPEQSVGKTAGAFLNQQIYALGLELLGLEATLWQAPHENGSTASDPDLAIVHAFLRSRANSIEGGTTEIMKNILAERVLGLPPEPRNDRDIPWRALPRG